MVLLVPMALHAKEFTEPAVAIEIEGLAKDGPKKVRGGSTQNLRFWWLNPKRI